ncbi:cytochrome P450 family protein [Cercophora newfieldiana]|uniref:Cytochrome P450 family protein n=1 Tax=Cercophora newfieldiana TaxID=92897 RepID=A0AA40CIL4_9PEZI|nr:cytochrome P450 family protein [Cercophora newfieldiana]
MSANFHAWSRSLIDSGQLAPSKLIADHWGKLLLAVPVYFILYTIFLAVYRLTFHPLAKFPGPKFTAASGWYEFYHDVILRGQFVYAAAKMHEEYGPIVRINPWEISVRDPAFYNTLYVAGSTRRTEIFPQLRDGIGSHAVAKDHDFHRMRRKPLDPFFSRQTVQRYEEMIVEEVNLIENKIASYKGTGKPITMDYVSAAMTGDLIVKICLANPPSFADEEDFAPDWYHSLYSFFGLLALYTNFTFLIGWMRRVPRDVLFRIIPFAARYRAFCELTKTLILKAKSTPPTSKPILSSGTPTLMEHLMAWDMPESEKTIDRLTGEFISILSAGTFTTARTLVTIVYYAVAQPEVGEKLTESVREIMKDYPEVMPRWSDLEKIPYLAVVVREGLRVSPGTLRRVVRCSPDVELRYGDWVIPKNVPTSMSAYMLHSDPNVYPEPKSFKPERWLGDYDKQMDRNFIPFSKGSRSCLGINLAYAELFITLAILFRPGAPRLRLYQTNESDVYPAMDLFIVAPKANSKGCRVTVE